MKNIFTILALIALAYLISISVYSQNQNNFDNILSNKSKLLKANKFTSEKINLSESSSRNQPLADSVSIEEIYELGQVPNPNGFPDTICVYYSKKYHGFPKMALKFTFKNYFTDATYFDTTIILSDTSIHNGTFCLKSPPFPVSLANYINSEDRNNFHRMIPPPWPLFPGLDAVEAVPGDTANPHYEDDTTDNTFRYGKLETLGSYNHADYYKVNDGGVGFDGVNGNFVAGFRNKIANPFFINSVEYSFYDSIGGGNHPYKIVVYGDNGSGKPGSLLYISSLLTTPAGTNSPNKVVHNIITPVSISGNSKFFVGYRQTSTTNISASFQNEIPIRTNSFYYSSPDTSTVWTDFRDGLADFRLDISAVGGNGVLNLKAIPQGFYNLYSLNMKDTLSVFLRDSISPYTIIDSGKGVIDSLTFSRSIIIINAPTGFYYIAVKHRNSIETWSKLPVSYTKGSTTSYDFTNAVTKAYGDNLILLGSKYCIYSGDVNQDGYVDLVDASLIDNDSYNFVTGYNPTDLNGDNIVDVSDYGICDNNSYNFVSKVAP